MPESVRDETRGLAARVKELRKARGWSMEQLGDVVGVTRSYISQIEQGKITLPKREVLWKLAEALKTTPEDLLYAAGYLPESELIKPEEIVFARLARGLSKEDLDWLRQTVEKLNRAS